ncbi:MAG: TolC family outer membrane protein [Gallionella sp.]|nr:TolC family outer membrane protein [Gallionella sp.]
MRTSALLVLLLSLPVGEAVAQVQTLKEVAQKAVLQNPEVLQRWHAYQASDSEREMAFGNYLPKVDLSMSSGKNYRNDTLIRDLSYSQRTSTLTLTQMLWDGFGTRSQVRQFDYAKRVRIHELHEVSESIALAAGQAYYDVLRYRKLVGFAEDNYIRHRSVFVQVQEKVKAGVGRRVDLEQASGRLALAEANLLTETSNLHDVSARFLRIVGEQPAVEMDVAEFATTAMPADVTAALRQTEEHNPSLRAAIENVRAAEASVDVRRSTFQPRVDLRLRQDHSTNLSGYSGPSNTRAAEVVVNWNLFNGLSDKASVKQYNELLNEARDIRDKTCRDVRQTATIAYNDTRKLSEQIGYLEQHRLSIEKARDAYRKQFDIGQRSLLDLLDTENELFQAKRAYVNAEFDLKVANVRTLAGSGVLLSSLGVSKLDNDLAAQDWNAGAEAAAQCPPEGPQLYVADKTALDAKADEIVREQAPVLAAQAMNTIPQGVSDALQVWAKAWRARDLPLYLSSYAQNFVPQTGITWDAWAAERKRIIGKAGPGEVTLELMDVKISATDPNHASTTFKQKYHSPVYNDEVTKTLDWVKMDNRWLIQRETVLPLVEH